MKNPVLSRSISLDFASTAKPGAAIPLDAESLKKLDLIPTMIKRLTESYGSRLGEPLLTGGTVVVEILKNGDLIEQADTIAADLTVTTAQLEANAKRQPPLLHKVCLTHPGLVPLLKSLSRAANAGLSVVLGLGGREIVLPQPEPAAFTQPDAEVDGHKMLRVAVIGLCVPRDDVFVVVLANSLILELPRNIYDESMVTLHEKIFQGDANFEGLAAVISARVLRARPGGLLRSQHRLHAARAVLEEAPTTT